MPIKLDDTDPPPPGSGLPPLAGMRLERMAIAHDMSALPGGFARTGRPTVEGLPDWPPYAPHTRAWPRSRRSQDAARGLRFSCVCRLLLLFVAMSAASMSHAAERRKVIIDNDGFSLMEVMLLNDPDVEVLGIASVTGDLWAKRAAAYALRGLEITGHSDVPVVIGATYPILNSEALTDRWEALYGKLVWKGVWMKQWVEPTAQATPNTYSPDDISDLSWGAPTIKASDEIAANFLIRMVRKYPGQISIIEGGPMTNLALAQRLDPQFASLAKELVYMGGSLNPRQVLDNKSAADFAREYLNTPRREFNIRFDPEAASIVSRSPWRSITVVPVDPSTATQLTPELLRHLAQNAGPDLARIIMQMEAGFPLWDETAAAVWIDPSLIKSAETLFVDYNTEFGPGYGDLLSWRQGYHPDLGERSATVVREIYPDRLEALMLRLMRETEPAEHAR